MSVFRNLGCYWVVTGFALLLGASSSRADIVYDIPDSVYVQNFDSLAGTTPIARTWTNDSTLAGWYAFAGNTALSSFLVTGGGTAFGLISYGPLNTSDRALGIGAESLSGQPAEAHIAVAFTNNTVGSLDSLSVTYDGEQWRRGRNAAKQSLTFSYGFGASYATIDWQNVPALTFTSPLTDGLSTASAVNGNTNSVRNLTANISGVDWAVNQTVWFRWTDLDNPGEEHGLGIDNFRFSATSTVAAVPRAIIHAAFRPH